MPLAWHIDMQLLLDSHNVICIRHEFHNLAIGERGVAIVPKCKRESWMLSLCT